MKRIGLGLAVIAAALVALVLIAPWLIPESAVREAVRRGIVEMTGREPVIGGAVHLSLAPLPTVTVDGVSIPGLYGTPPLLEADTLQATLRLSSMLIGQIEVSSLALGNPRLALIATKDGRHSWDFKEGALARAASGLKDANLPIKSIRLIRGTISYSDATTGQATVVMVEDATVNWSSLTDTMSASGVINWRRRSADISVSIADPASLVSGGTSDLRVKVKGELLNMTASGNLSGDGKLEGKLTASGASLRETLRWLGLDLPDGRSLAGFTVESPVVIDANGATLSDVQLELDGNSAEGALTVQLSGPRPKVSGTLAADSLDLTPYSGGMQLSGDAAPSQWRTDDINLKDLVVSDVDLRISSAETTFGKAKFGSAAAAISTHDGLLDIAVGEALAYGGTVKGRVTLKMAGGGTEFSASGNFDSVELGKALADLAGFHKIEGTGSGTIEVAATGASVADLSRSLEGQAHVTVTSGALIGIDLADLMQKIEKRPLSARFESSYGGRTVFDKAQASFKIVKGMAATKDCHFDNGNLSVKLVGETNIALRSLDMAGIASWVDSDGVDPFKLPFRLSGAWDMPSVEPDTQALIRRSGAAAPLLRSFIKPGQDITQDSVTTTPAATTAQ
jgi:AsmA protein